MRSQSFDNMVELYDETRACCEECLGSALDYLVERFPPSSYRDVFEPGIGTGRIAIPLAERGYRVTGIDVSEQMLAVLGRRLGEYSPPLPIEFQVGDTTSLPFADDAFDMAIAVHLFYFIKDWRKAVDEIVRVVRPNAPLVLMNTGFGTEVPFLIKRYKELCTERGLTRDHLGVQGTQEVVDYLEHLGYTVSVDTCWEWTNRISLIEAVGYLRSRAYSYTATTPDDIHLAALDAMESELARDHGSLDAEAEVANQIKMIVMERRAE